MCGPLVLDICGVDDGDVHIQMEFASPNFVINTHQDCLNYKLHVDLCELTYFHKLKL